MISRRAFLGSAAACGIAGCAPVVVTTPTGTVTVDPGFLDAVINIVRAGCGLYQGFAPTVNSVIQVATLMFGGPALAVISTIAGAVNSVATALCAAAAPAPLAMHLNGRRVRTRGIHPTTLAQRLAVSSPQNPVVIGKISVGGVAITVMGYK